MGNKETVETRSRAPKSINLIGHYVCHARGIHIIKLRRGEMLSFRKHSIQVIDRAGESMAPKESSILDCTGDQNMKFFQKFSNYRKSYNTIWELNDSSSDKIRGFSNLANLSMSHFEQWFKELE